MRSGNNNNSSVDVFLISDDPSQPTMRTMQDTTLNSPKRHKYYLEPKQDTSTLRHKIQQQEQSVQVKANFRSAAAKHSMHVNVSDFTTLKREASLKA